MENLSGNEQELAMKLSGSPFTLAVLIALQGCITQSNAPSVVEQTQPPERIEQVYVDGRLQFVVCRDCPVITPKQVEEEPAAAAAPQQQKVSGNDAIPVTPFPKEQALGEPDKQLSAQKDTGAVQSLMKGDIYEMPPATRPDKDDPIPATKTETTEPIAKPDESKIDALLAQTVAEKNALEAVTAPGQKKENAIAVYTTAVSETAHPVTLAANDATAAQKETAGMVSFGFNQKKLNEASEKEIEQILPLTMNASKLVLNGYTDSVGSNAYNDVLAMQRAINTKQALRRMGINIDIDVSGEGNCCYVASNDTEEGRAKNRRVEISVIDLRKPQTAKASKDGTENHVKHSSL
ncbi:MAG: OmpA family protein [Sulfuricaulis sp.]